MSLRVQFRDTYSEINRNLAYAYPGPKQWKILEGDIVQESRVERSLGTSFSFGATIVRHDRNVRVHVKASS